MRCLLTLIVAASLHAQGDSDVRPPVTPADLKIVKRAREILNSPTVWNRADTRICPPDAKTFSLYCALQRATIEIGAQFAHRGAAMQEARFAIEEIAPKRDYDHRLMGYNNDPTTTFADIQKVFDALEARVAHRLATEPPSPAAAPASAPQPIPAQQIAVIKRVRVLLDSESKWSRAPGPCAADATTYSLICAFQKALMEITGSGDLSGAAIQQARALVSEIDPTHAKYANRLVDYNKDPSITFVDLRKFLETVENRLTKQ
jgi:hypothetical protein